MLRNTIAATPNGSAELRARQVGDDAEMDIANALDGTMLDGVSGSGMGIGLIIVRTVVEAHGGTPVHAEVPDRCRDPIARSKPVAILEGDADLALSITRPLIRQRH